MIWKIVAEFGAWSWWIAGFLLLVLEVVLPGVFFLWIGLAALVVGTAALLTSIAWQTQIIAFAVMALFFAVLGRRIYARFGGKNDGGRMLNQRAEQYIGQIYRLQDGLVNGEGRVMIGDTYWLVHGPDGLPAGAEVKVKGLQGTVLLVDAA